MQSVGSGPFQTKRAIKYILNNLCCCWMFFLPQSFLFFLNLVSLFHRLEGGGVNPPEYIIFSLLSVLVLSLSNFLSLSLSFPLPLFSDLSPLHIFTFSVCPEGVPLLPFNPNFFSFSPHPQFLLSQCLGLPCVLKSADG